MRTIDWYDGVITIVDQTALPLEVTMRDLHDVDGLITAIGELAVRGALGLIAAALEPSLEATNAMGPARSGLLPQAAR